MLLAPQLPLLICAFCWCEHWGCQAFYRHSYSPCMGREEHQLPKNREHTEYIKSIKYYYFGDLKWTNTVINATVSHLLPRLRQPNLILFQVGNTTGTIDHVGITTSTSYRLFSHSHNFVDWWLQHLTRFIISRDEKVTGLNSFLMVSVIYSLFLCLGFYFSSVCYSCIVPLFVSIVTLISCHESSLTTSLLFC